MTATTFVRAETELIPGTDILLSSGDGSTDAERICLIPAPSDQPDDPLVSYPPRLPESC